MNHPNEYFILSVILQVGKSTVYAKLASECIIQ